MREEPNSMDGIGYPRQSVQNRSGQSCRLLYVVGQLGQGGLERQLLYLLRTMDRERYRPVVVVWNYREQDPYVSKIRELCVPLLSVGNSLSPMGKMVTFRRMVVQLCPEVVHSCSFHTNIAAWWATLGSTAVSVGSVRNSFLFSRHDAGRILGRLCARWPRVQIFNSQSAKTEAEGCTSLVKPGRMYVVRNGLDLSYFSSRPNLLNMTLLAVGSLYPRKRWDRLLRIIALLVSRGMQFQVRLVGDGPLRGDLEGLARNLGVQGVVQFLGSRKDIPKLLTDSTFLVHTAEDEGCPNVVMEAMASGRAVVAMNAGDIPFLIDDGETGFVVQRGDETRFAERVQQLLSSQQLCCRMGMAARVRAEQEFRLDRLLSETFAVYRVAGWKDVQTVI